MKNLIRSLFVILPLLTVACFGAPSTNANVGQSVTISVTADGTQPFTYQWSKNGALIANATGSTYVILAVTPGDAGVYTVAVFNSAGSTISDNATLTVSPVIVPPTKAVTTFQVK